MRKQKYDSFTLHISTSVTQDASYQERGIIFWGPYTLTSNSFSFHW